MRQRDNQNRLSLSVHRRDPATKTVPQTEQTACLPLTRARVRSPSRVHTRQDSTADIHRVMGYFAEAVPT